MYAGAAVLGLVLQGMRSKMFVVIVRIVMNLTVVIWF